MLAPVLALAMMQSQGTYVATVFGPNGDVFIEHCREVAKLERKEQGDSDAAEECLAYISGVVDGAQFAAKGDRKLFPVCFPPAVTTGQMAKIVAKYGDDHTDKLNNGGTYLVVRSLQQAFPCAVK